MAVKTKEQLLEYIKNKTADDTSDDTLNFIADITDTLDDYENKLHDQTDWKKKFEENDKEWRNKYKERFFEGDPDAEATKPETEEEETAEPKTYDDLFVEEKKGA